AQGDGPAEEVGRAGDGAAVASAACGSGPNRHATACHVEGEGTLIDDHGAGAVEVENRAAKSPAAAAQPVTPADAAADATSTIDAATAPKATGANAAAAPTKPACAAIAGAAAAAKAPVPVAATAASEGLTQTVTSEIGTGALVGACLTTDGEVGGQGAVA